MPYLDETLKSLNAVSGKSVLLVTKDENQEELMFYCDENDGSNVIQLTREQYKREFGLTRN